MYASLRPCLLLQAGCQPSLRRCREIPSFVCRRSCPILLYGTSSTIHITARPLADGYYVSMYRKLRAQSNASSARALRQ